MIKAVHLIIKKEQIPKGKWPRPGNKELNIPIKKQKIKIVKSQSHLQSHITHNLKHQRRKHAHRMRSAAAPTVSRSFATLNRSSRILKSPKFQDAIDWNRTMRETDQIGDWDWPLSRNARKSDPSIFKSKIRMSSDLWYMCKSRVRRVDLTLNVLSVSWIPFLRWQLTWMKVPNVYLSHQRLNFKPKNW